MTTLDITITGQLPARTLSLILAEILEGHGDAVVEAGEHGLAVRDGAPRVAASDAGWSMTSAYFVQPTVVTVAESVGTLEADLNESVKAIEEKRHVCPRCDRVFASAAGLDSHRRWSHQSPPGPAPKPAPAERFDKPAPAQKAQDDGIDWPWKCACGHGTGQRVEMIRHINLKGGAKTGHRIVDQPPARLVPSGVNTVPDTDKARAAAFAEPGGELAD